MINVGKSTVVIESGTKIAQFILVPVSYEDLEEVTESELFAFISDRGDGGFGSTGND